MKDFITEIAEAADDLKKEKEEQERRMRKERSKAYGKSHRRR